MNHPVLKQVLPHLGGVLILLLVAFTYFLPAVNGDVISRSDNQKAKGMQGEMRRYIDETGKAPLWTNAAFGGMPTYQIMGSAKGNLGHKIQKVIMFGNGVVPPHTSLFLTFVCAYLMFVVLGLDWRLGVLGAIAYGLTANFAILTEAGHSTKLIALAYAPAVLAGVFLLYQKKYLIGLGVLSLFNEFGGPGKSFTDHLLSRLNPGLLWSFPIRGDHQVQRMEALHYGKCAYPGWRRAWGHGEHQPDLDNTRIYFGNSAWAIGTHQ